MMKLNEDYAVNVRGLTVAYDSRAVLSDVDIDIKRGKITAIMGPNGAGKTTLLKAMLKLIPKSCGSVTWNEVNGRPPVIGYVPQSESVDWDFPATVWDVVTMGCYKRLGWIKRPKKEDRELSLQMLKKMGMEKCADRQISCLSGGQQQRAFIARALVQQADIYFMDEPFKGVDAATEKTIVELFRELKKEGKTVVAVHHDLSTAADYFDEAVLINRRVIMQGNVKAALTQENLSLTYRGTTGGEP